MSKLFTFEFVTKQVFISTNNGVDDILKKKKIKKTTIDNGHIWKEKKYS